MANEFQGLFQGAGVGDVRQAMEQERVGRIRQAMANTGNLGTQYTPNYAAAIAGGRQEMSEAIGGLGRAVGNEMGMEIPDDPRIQKAQQREKDKGEIMGILGGFSDPKSPGGKKITQQEMEIGFSELMKRGYTKEAQEFLSMSQSMRKMDIDAASVAQRSGASGVKGAQHAFEKITKHRDSKGRILLRSVSKEKTGGKVKFEWTDEAGNVVDSPTGKLQSLDEGGQTTAEVQADRAALIVKRREEKTTGAKEESDIDAGAATKLKWKDSRQAMIDLGEAAKLEFQDITRAIELTDKIKTGGGMQMVLKVRQFLGVNSGDAGELASLFRTGVIARLKEMGTKPTDKDLEYLESAVQNLGQDQETNQRILRRMVGRVKQVISRGEYLKANKGMTQEDFNDNGYKARTYQWEGEEGERTPVSPPVSWDSL